MQLILLFGQSINSDHILTIKNTISLNGQQLYYVGSWEKISQSHVSENSPIATNQPPKPFTMEGIVE